MTEFKQNVPSLGARSLYVPVLYSLKQLNKMKQSELGSDSSGPSVSQNSVIKKDPEVQDTSILDNLQKQYCVVNSEVIAMASDEKDSSDDDEISVISVKLASKPVKPLPKKPNNSFEITLIKSLNVKEKKKKVQNYALKVPTTTKVNLFVPVKKKIQSKKVQNNKKPSESIAKEFPYFPINNEKSNAIIEPVDLKSFVEMKMEKSSDKQITKDTKLVSGNEKKVLNKQEVIENMRKELLTEAENLEEKMMSLNMKDKQITELNKRVQILTKEKDAYIKNENYNKNEINKVKASFIQKNLENQQLQNKLLLLTEDYRKSEESRRKNENMIDNSENEKEDLHVTINNLKTNIDNLVSFTKKEKEDLNEIIKNLKTNLKVLPRKEKRIEELQKEVKILTERDTDLQILKIKVLPEKDRIIEGLEKKDTLKEKLIAALKEKVSEFTEKEKDFEDFKNKALADKELHDKELTQFTEKIKYAEKVENMLQSEKDKNDQNRLDMAKKEEIIEYFEEKVNSFTEKEKDFEAFRAKVLTEKAQHEKESENLLQSEKDKVCELLELNENYVLKINSLRSELVELNMSNMYDDKETEDAETKKQLVILSKEKEDLIEQTTKLVNDMEMLSKEKEDLFNNNTKLVSDLSDKENEILVLKNENEVKISSLESTISETKSSLITKKELNNKLQDAVDDLEEQNGKREESIINSHLKIDELTKSLLTKESTEKEAWTKIASLKDNIRWLENKLDEKRKVLASTAESNKVIAKKYAALKIEKADLIKEIRNISSLNMKIKSLEEQLVKSREDNGDEPALVIDDQVDQPTTSKSAKSCSPVKMPEVIKSRDPRKKAIHSRQISNTPAELADSSFNEDSKVSANPREAVLENLGGLLTNLTPESSKSALSPNLNAATSKPLLPFHSIFDINEPPPTVPAARSIPSILDINVPPPVPVAPSIPLPNALPSPMFHLNAGLNIAPLIPPPNATLSPTSHLNAGLSQLSSWMTQNTIKSLSEYKPLTNSSTLPTSKPFYSIPQNEPVSNYSSYSPSWRNVPTVSGPENETKDWPRKRSRSRSIERDDAETKRPRSRRGSRERESESRARESMSRERSVPPERSSSRARESMSRDRSGSLVRESFPFERERRNISRMRDSESRERDSFSRERERSDYFRINDRRSYDRSNDYYYGHRDYRQEVERRESERERRSSGQNSQNSPSGKKVG